MQLSLDEIRNRVNDPDWWYATRAMSAFVLVVAEEIGFVGCMFIILLFVMFIC